MAADPPDYPHYPNSPATGADGPSGESELTVQEIFRTLWRRKMLLIGTVFTVTMLAAIVVYQLTPVYTAVTKVMIDPRTTQIIDIEAVVSGLPADMETIASEIEVLRSTKTAKAVVDKLQLYRDPEFNPALRPPSPLWEYLSLRNILPAELIDPLIPPAEELEPSDQENRERAGVVATFLSKLKVARRGRSRVIEVAIKSEDPRTAALVANTLADVYLVAQLEAKFEATKRATEWLSERLTKLRQAVGQSERAVERYRRSSGLIKGKGSTLASQQVTELNTQIILARTKRAEAEARLRQVKRLLGTRAGADSAAEVLTSPLIQRLREQEARVQRKAAELSQEFGEKHPRMINIRAEIRDLKRKIGAEVGKIVKGLQNEVNIAYVREQSLIQSLGQIETRVGQQNRSEVQLRALEREANANRTLYETFLNRFKETSEQQGIQQPDARVISRADIPMAPSFPKKSLFIGVAMFGSIFIGIGLIALIENLDHGFRSMVQIEQMMGVASLGLVPAIGSGRGRKEPHNYILKNPVSAFGESVRALYTGLLLSNVDNPPKVVLVTSALPGEGKTTLSASLARMVSRMINKNVILVDCDLRRPQMHTKFGLPQKPGLVEYLAGEASLNDVLRRDRASNALVLVAGRATTNSMDLLSSDQFKDLLAKLGNAADLVVLDSSPVMAVSDSRMLSRLADKTVFVVRWAETRREVAMAGLKQITDAGSQIAGVVLSMVNVSQHARYGYGDSGTYYGRYRKYYAS